MFGLPSSTEFNKRIPKQTFYENLDVSPGIKRCFVEQIKTIYWKNKISPETMNLEAGESVTEIQIFQIKLSGRELDESVLTLIDKKIPYHIVFILENEWKYQVWIAYKEATFSGSNAFKVGTYYHTQWMDEEEIPLKVEGLSTDRVYENFFRQISGIIPEKNRTLYEQIAVEGEKEKLEKEMIKLESQARRETQSKKKYELHERLMAYKKKLEEM